MKTFFKCAVFLLGLAVIALSVLSLYDRFLAYRYCDCDCDCDNYGDDDEAVSD